MPDTSARLPLLSRARLYFTDLSFYTRSTLGPSAARARQRWLIFCYLAFAAGVFCRQLIDLSKFPDVDTDLSRLKLSKLAASFIVGLVIFPFAVRHVRKLADYIFIEDEGHERSKAEGSADDTQPPPAAWNMLHVFTSFTTGFLVNLIYEKVLQIIRT
jgi:hypothetical protein